MPTENIHNRAVEMSEAGDGDPAIQVDGAPVPVERLPDGTYETDLLPYRTFSSLRELATDVIAHHPDYRATDG